jgi:hypothetical protein
MKLKPITIVTVTYNSSRTIIPLLKSICTGNNYQYVDNIVIIENNSPDYEITISKIKKYIFKNKYRVKVILSKSNSGFAKSCNLGAREAKSEYVLFLNPDTMLKDNSLRILYEHAQNNQADIIGGTSIKYANKVHRTVVRHPGMIIGLFELTSIGKLFHITKGQSDFYYEDIENLYFLKHDINVDAVSGAYLMARVKSFKKLHGFDTNFFMYLEDVDLGYRANQKKMKVIFCPHSKISHIGGASSKNVYHIRHQAWYDSRKYYYKKHHNFFVNLIIQPVFTVEESILKIRENFL